MLMLAGIICITIFGTRHSGHDGKAALLAGCIEGNGVVAAFTPDVNLQPFFGEARETNHTVVSCGNSMLPSMFAVHRVPPRITLGATEASRAVTEREGQQHYYVLMMVDPDQPVISTTASAGAGSAATPSAAAANASVPPAIVVPGGRVYLNWLVANINASDPASMAGCAPLMQMPATPSSGGGAGTSSSGAPGGGGAPCTVLQPYEVPRAPQEAPFTHRYVLLLFRVATALDASTLTEVQNGIKERRFDLAAFASKHLGGALARPVGGNMFRVTFPEPIAASAGRRLLRAGGSDHHYQYLQGMGAKAAGQPGAPDLFRLDGTPYWDFFELEAGLPPGFMSRELGLGADRSLLPTHDAGELR